MKLSKRLQCIADLVPENSRVIDVGCDHGLLSIFLANEKKCRCVAADINSNALSSAELNVKKYECKNIELKVTDGINDITINKQDYIVIAGMGTTTIKHILSNKKLSDNLIVASNNQIFELRDFVIKLGYIIDSELFIDDHQKKYVIIKFIRGTKKYSKNDILYGPLLKTDLNYLAYELQKKLEIKEKISDNSFIARKKIELEISKIKKLIKNLEEK